MKDDAITGRVMDPIEVAAHDEIVFLARLVAHLDDRLTQVMAATFQPRPEDHPALFAQDRRG